MPIRLAATVAAVALLCSCGSRGSGTAATSVASPTAASVPATATRATGVPANAPVPAAGARAAIPLDDAQRRELDAAVASAPAALRDRLRYALATGDDGKVHLVVYDGEGLGPSGRRPGHPHDYLVFRVINSTAGEHYDPVQNALVAPIPPPPQRDVQMSRP